MMCSLLLGKMMISKNFLPFDPADKVFLVIIQLKLKRADRNFRSARCIKLNIIQVSKLFDSKEECGSRKGACFEAGDLSGQAPTPLSDNFTFPSLTGPFLPFRRPAYPRRRPLSSRVFQPQHIQWSGAEKQLMPHFQEQ